MKRLCVKMAMVKGDDKSKGPGDDDNVVEPGGLGFQINKRGLR
jgi:hypothetical protein